tara:strand:- start:1341 stop:2204 length:864 start_codon:yes stop_codon:yes gene_type:complete
MKILITGAGTMLGNYLSLKLSKDNQVYATYNNSFPKNLQKHKNIKIIKIDLTKKFSINQNFDALIHCASAVPAYNYNNKKMEQIDVLGFKKILKICKTNNCKKIVFFSAISIYGRKIRRKNITESDKPNPKDIYSKNKLKCEKMLKKYSQTINSEILILRLSALLGPGSKNNFLSSALKKIKDDKKISIKNPNLKYNNLSHVKNIYEIIFKFFMKQSEKFEIYNLASTKPMKFLNIFKIFFKKNKIKENIVIEKNNSGFNIKINKKLIQKYPLYTTTKALQLFLKDN